MGEQGSFQIVVARDDCRAQGIDVACRLLGAQHTGRANEEMFLECAEFDWVGDHAEVIPLQDVVGQMKGLHDAYHAARLLSSATTPRGNWPAKSAVPVPLPMPMTVLAIMAGTRIRRA